MSPISPHMARRIEGLRQVPRTKVYVGGKAAGRRERRAGVIAEKVG